LTVLGLFAVLALAGCVKATQDLVLRAENGAPGAGTLCERMAEDYDMVVAGGSELRGRLYRVSHARRMFSADWQAASFRLTDQNPAETCVQTNDTVICSIEGPAEFQVQSAAGRAVYLVAPGERAQVTSEGAVMTCEERP
jgi:hypothetical protein